MVGRRMAGRGMSNDSEQPESDGSVLSRKVWNRARHNGQLVRDEVTGALPPMLRPVAWERFRQMPMARYACLLLSLLESREDAGLYRRRSRRPAGAGPFDDIPSLADRDRAERIFAKLCERHAERLPSRPWLRPILAGRARSLATHPDAHGSAWGRKMRRKKAGRHTQRRYREQGWHPLASSRQARGLPADRAHRRASGGTPKPA
jgi:hypothetical protein